MSHLTERKEKNCLNCNTLVQGRYCHVCGQENIVPQDTFGHLFLHFIYDITHFDGKFFETLKYLLTKPGFLSAEYIAGRRAKYLNPIRMYVFTSAFFFLVFFALKGDSVVNFTGNEPITPSKRDSLITELQLEFEQNPADSSPYRTLQILLDTTRKEIRPSDLLVEGEGFVMMATWGNSYKTRAEYDSAQLSLPANQRDGWLKRTWNKKAYEVKEKYGRDPQAGFKVLADSFMHRVPYLLFISLPLFAWILKLLYLRNKNYLYAGHIIFSIHQYIFGFIVILLLTIFDMLGKSGIRFFDVVGLILLLLPFLYLLLSMKRFYKQGWLVTIGKTVLASLSGLLILIILFLAFILFSVFQL
jgi:hypothetical protein